MTNRKLSLLLPLLLCASVILTGCHLTTTTTPSPVVLAPGFQNLSDQDMDQVLVGARHFYVAVQTKVAAGTYKPSTSEFTAFNSFAVALNTAEVIYKAFHAGTATQAQAQAAVNVVAAQQTSLQNVVSQGGK